jgi:hypothetical protein
LAFFVFFAKSQQHCWLITLYSEFIYWYTYCWAQLLLI